MRRIRPNPILMRGPSGIGKSEVVKAVHREILADGYEAAMIHEVESPAHTTDTLIDDLAGQLIASDIFPLTNPREFAQSIIRVARDKTWSIASAALLDLTGRILPGSRAVADELVKQISKELGQTAPHAMVKRLRSNASQDLIVGLLNILRALDQLGVPGSIIIDQAEASSETVREALLGIATQLPERWGMLIAVNDELPEGIDFINRVWPRLAYAGGLQIVLQPLGVGALEAWCLRERASVPGRIELESVISNCQGRPLLLREWVSGASGDAEIANIWQRLGPYYLRRLNSLSRDAKAVIRSLALLPAASKFPLPFIARIAGVSSNTQAFEIVEELVNAQFLEPDSEVDTYRFVHDVTKRQVTLATPRAVIKESAANVVAALKSLEQVQDDLQRRYEMAMLEYRAEDYSSFLVSALPTASDLKARGSYGPAIELYRAYFSVGAERMSSSAEIEARLGMSSVLHATGYYYEGLRFVENADAWPGLQGARGLLIRSKHLLRLDRFEEARATIASAQDRYSASDNYEGVMQCEKEDVTILRDLGRYQDAVAKATDLVSRASQYKVSQEVLASCYRALARSLAFTGPMEEAVAAGNQALGLALTTSPSDVGNAHLALGEAYRLGDQSIQGIKHYDMAAQLALSVGNRDSYLWSMLGLSDCHFLLGDLSTAHNLLIPVGEIVRLSPSRYPLEHLHWRISSLAIDYLSGDDVFDLLMSTISAYAELGVVWPQTYVAKLTSGAPASAKLF